MNAELFSWVIENLVKNAIDAMSGAGQISIYMSKTGVDKLTLDIEDDGKGMTPKTTRQIFSPGYTTKARGWGLGLTLSKRIIENYHRGKIIIKKSALDKGTTFRILLDIAI